MLELRIATAICIVGWLAYTVAIVRINRALGQLRRKRPEKRQASLPPPRARDDYREIWRQNPKPFWLLIAGVGLFVLPLIYIFLQ